METFFAYFIVTVRVFSLCHPFRWIHSFNRKLGLPPFYRSWPEPACLFVCVRYERERKKNGNYVNVKIHISLMDVPEAACTKRRHMQIAQSLTKLFFAWLSERAAYYSESPKHSTQLGHASNSSSDTREIEALPFFRQTFCPIQMAFYRFSDHNKSSCIIRMKSTMLISNHIRIGSISICVELLFSYTFPSKAQYRNFTFLFFL